jgi:Galactosyltransferase/Protein-L-isoaspartate(D-aspartate) O-methyltransferase (PCMT)
MNLFVRKKYELFSHSGVKLEIPTSLLPKDVRQRLLNGQYELDKTSEILPVLQPGDVVLEFGSGIGFTSTKIAQETKVARVISVERDQQLIDIARRTHQLNGVSVQLISTLVTVGGGETVSKISPGSPDHSADDWVSSSVHVLLTEWNPTVLVVDTKGEELSILQSASIPSIRIIVVKFHPDITGFQKISRIFSLLSAAGFSCESSTGTVATFEQNYLTSKEKDEEVNLLTSSQYFDAGWYLTTYPDVNAAGINPIRHYLEFGATEGRNPSAIFDAQWYRQHNPDVGSTNPLLHFLRIGYKRGSEPHPLGILRHKIDRLSAPKVQQLVEQFSGTEPDLPAPTDEDNCVANRDKWARYFVSRGCLAISAGENLGALELFKRAVQICPEWASAWALYGHAFRTHNSAALRLFDESLEQTELLVVHVSCEARIAKALSSAISFADPKGRIKNLVVVGAKRTNTKFDFDPVRWVLTVPASDSYEHLPLKVYLMFCFLGLSSLGCSILKVDDDVHCQSLGKLFDDLAYPITGSDYGGSIFLRHSRLDDNHFWHFGKCSDSDTNYRPDGLFFLQPYASGPYYWLGPSCLNLLSRAAVIHERYFGFEIGLEDRAVGTVLNYYGVRPQHHVLASLKCVGKEFAYEHRAAITRNET